MARTSTETPPHQAVGGSENHRCPKCGHRFQTTDPRCRDCFRRLHRKPVGRIPKRCARCQKAHQKRLRAERAKRVVIRPAAG